jgi:hypothetical protein
VISDCNFRESAEFLEALRTYFKAKDETKLDYSA